MNFITNLKIAISVEDWNTWLYNTPQITGASMADQAILNKLHLHPSNTPPPPSLPRPHPPQTWYKCGFKQSTHTVQERESIHSIAVRPISMTRVLYIPASFFLPPSISNLLFGNASVS